MNRRRESLLYLQMGQEVIYILLACAIVTSLLLLSMWVRSRANLSNLQDGAVGLLERMERLQIDIDKHEADIRKYADQIKRTEAELLQLKKTDSDLHAYNVLLLSEMDKLKAENRAQRAEIEALRKVNNDQPPIILLTESAGYTFETGSAKISSSFRENVQSKIVPDLKKYAERYAATIIEIIGHTDEVPFGGLSRGGSNLDRNLFGVLNGNAPADSLIAFDNIGLGMARAISVRRLLIELGLGSSFVILPLSAGPAVTPDDAIAQGLSPQTGIEARRRIEIRLRRKSKTEAQAQPK